MSEPISKTRDRLRAQWLAANQKSLMHRNKAEEASRQAAAIQKALDALEEAMSRMPATARETTSRGTKTRGTIVALLREKGPMSGKSVADALGLSYSAVIGHLQAGPFKSEQDARDRRLRVWMLDEAAEAASPLDSASA